MGRVGVLAIIVAVLSPACGTTPVAKPQGTGKVDDFLVVDCFLPPQIRQLGSQVTYLTPPRAMKTSARDCEIRGGEYVAYDRSSYKTALGVWLPLAEQGDPAAQTYVGEIFEKGLGVAPDHTAAAQWYRRAAERGYSRAAINLGQLYEQGLGVPKNPAQALSWYRRAAGLSDLSFEVAPGGAAQEIERLRKEVEGLRRELQAKQAELERTSRELENARRALEQRRSEAEAERAALGRLRQDLAEVRQKGQAGAARQRELEQAVADGEARLTAKDRELADLRASVARLEAASAERRTEIESLRQRTASAGPEIQLIEPELIATRDSQPKRVQASGSELTVVGRVTSALGLMSLTVNGHEERLDTGNMFKTRVPVTKAEERVRIVAIDRGGRKSTLEFMILERAGRAAAVDAAKGSGIGHPRPRDFSFGTYHALVIGNNEYRLVQPLQTAVNDAKEVARILEKEYGFRVRLLLNATHYDILSALNNLRQGLTDKDNLLVYYAGHGVLDRKNQRGHWLPVDAEPDSSANWISNVAITDILNAMTVRQLLVVADSCYSGTLTRSALGRLEGGISQEERLKSMRIMAQGRSRMVLTSGGLEPVLDSMGGRYSVFAQPFIDLLLANDGLLTGQELFNLLRFRVIATADRLEAHQIPEYAPIKFAGHESGDFFFVRASN